MRATASALRASAASPYTVSVGTATGCPAAISAAASAIAALSNARTLVEFEAWAMPRYSARATIFTSKEPRRSEEHTSELQSLMRISYAVFCLKKKITNTSHTDITRSQATHSDLPARRTHHNTQRQQKHNIQLYTY